MTMPVYNSRVKAALTDLKGAISAKDGATARRIMEMLSATDPEAAAEILTDLNAKGHGRMHGGR